MFAASGRSNAAFFFRAFLRFLGRKMPILLRYFAFFRPFQGLFQVLFMSVRGRKAL